MFNLKFKNHTFKIGGSGYRTVSKLIAFIICISGCQSTLPKFKLRRLKSHWFWWEHSDVFLVFLYNMWLFSFLRSNTELSQFQKQFKIQILLLSDVDLPLMQLWLSWLATPRNFISKALFGNSFFRNLFKSLPLFNSKFCSTVCVFVLSPLQLFETTSPVAHQAPMSMGFPRQKYWSRLPFPPPGDLPDPGIKLMSLVFPTLIGGFFTTVPWSSTVKMVKNPPVMQETGVKSLGQEDLLEKKIVIHSSILAWRITWTEEPGELQSRGSQRFGHDWATNTFTYWVVMKSKKWIS